MTSNVDYAARWIIHVVLGLCGSIGLVYYAHSEDWTLMWTFAFAVIPIGAVIWGFLASVEFAVVGRLLQVGFSGLAALIALSGALCGYFQLLSLDFQRDRDAGVLPQDVRSFSAYLDTRLHSARITSHDRTKVWESDSLGETGYLVLILQLGGLAVGTAFALGILVADKYCRHCHRYYSRSARNTQCFNNPDEFSNAAAKVKSLLEQGQILQGLSFHSRSGRRNLKEVNAAFKTSTLIATCPSCKRRQLKYAGYKRNERNYWEEVAWLGVDLDLPPVKETVTPHQVDLGPVVTYDLRQNGMVYGPLSPEQLAQMVQRRQLLLTDYVRRSGSSALITVAEAIAE